MNCAECRETLVAYLEGALSTEESQVCQAHLETCPACRAERDALARLQVRLTARGQAAADVSLIGPVMQRIRAIQSQTERKTIMSRLFVRWGFGLSAAAAAAVVLVLFLSSPRASATAAEVMARGAKAVARLTSIHLRGQLRTAPQDNFSAIMPEQDFVTVELWKQFTPQLKWRVDKPGRVATMDGQSTLLYIKTANVAMKLPQPSPSAFDTQWLHEMANLSQAIESELRAIQAQGWPMTLTQQRGPDGKAKSVVTVEANSGLPDSDYLKNKFFMTADTRRVYVFDNASERLEAARIYLHGASGDLLVFDLNQIDYNPSLDAGTFEVQLPANVSWYQEPQKLPDNEKYASMTAEQAAKAFFEACGRSDWTEAAKFCPMPFNEEQRQYLAGLQIISLGESFTSQGSDTSDRFVPYEIKFKSGDVRKHNLALRKEPGAGRWIVNGGL